MKHKWIICVLAMLLPVSALAWEDVQYISPADSIYWHANASCQGEFLLEADSTKGHFPCPVCVQEDVKPEITAVERGGTIILKMPDSWARSCTDIIGIFAGTSADVYEGDEAVDIVGQYLHGDAYNAFMKSWEETSKAEAWTWEPGIYPENNELFMNERYIGGSWYVTMRPDWVSGNSIRMYLRFFCGTMEADGDRVYVDIHSEWDDFNYKLKFSKKQNKSSTFSKDYGDFSIDIYDELDTNIAVIRQKNADKELLQEVRLTVADQPDIILNGYMAGTDGVFCGTLTDGENHLIRTGAPVKLWHEPWYTEEDFQGTDYAIAQKDTGGYGVIDREGNFVLGPGYDSAQRNGNTVFLEYESRDWEVINLNTMEMIAEFEYNKKDKWISIHPENSAVFGVSIGDMWYIHENESGFLLAALNVNDENAPDYPSSHGIDGRYACYEIGYPQRLVFWRRDSAYEFHAWLADNHGNRLSDNYTCIEPLIWNVDKGVYAIQYYNDLENSLPNNINKFLEGFDGQSDCGEEWRVGLMDEDGNIIAPMEYVYIKVHSPTEIELHKEDGTVELVQLG